MVVDYLGPLLREVQRFFRLSDPVTDTRPAPGLAAYHFSVGDPFRTVVEVAEDTNWQPPVFQVLRRYGHGHIGIGIGPMDLNSTLLPGDPLRSIFPDIESRTFPALSRVVEETLFRQSHLAAVFATDARLGDLPKLMWLAEETDDGKMIFRFEFTPDNHVLIHTNVAGNQLNPYRTPLESERILDQTFFFFEFPDGLERDLAKIGISEAGLGSPARSRIYVPTCPVEGAQFSQNPWSSIKHALDYLRARVTHLHMAHSYDWTAESFLVHEDFMGIVFLLSASLAGVSFI